MNLYKKYLQLWRDGKCCAGFSSRMPDYGIQFWLKNFEKTIKQCPNGKFLDIGAGDGRLSRILLHEYSSTGVAIEVQVNHAAWKEIQKESPNFEFKSGLVQDWLNEFKSKSAFNLIILVEVFEHIPPAEALDFLKQLHEIISSDGVLFITTPNRIVQGPAENSPIWHEKQPYGHRKHYTYEELKDILSQAGFQVEWHGFECHWLKTTLYNKLFYPTSRLDARLTESRKIPMKLRKFYKYASIPILFGINCFFWTLAQTISFVEKKYGNQKSSATIMLQAKKINSGLI